MARLLRCLVVATSALLLCCLAPAEKLPSQPEVTVDQARALILRAFPALDAARLTYKGEVTEEGVRVLRFEASDEGAPGGSFDVAVPGYLWHASLSVRKPSSPKAPALSRAEAERIAKDFLARIGATPPEQWQASPWETIPDAQSRQSLWWLGWGDVRNGVLHPSWVTLAVDAESKGVSRFTQRRIPAKIGTTPRTPAEAARKAALKYCGRGTSVAAPRCVVLVNEKGSQRLVWMVQVDIGEGMHVIVDVSAISGRVIGN
ncbi:hypothetical protein LLH03_19505 [bacterium]|nr:hypothetical protein [bacterium]